MASTASSRWRWRSCSEIWALQPRARQRMIQKACYDAKIYLMGGLMTLLFLRSCISGGEMVSPLHDFHRGRRQLYSNYNIIQNLQKSDINPKPLISSTTRSTNIDDSHHDPVDSSNSLSVIKNRAAMADLQLKARVSVLVSDAYFHGTPENVHDIARMLENKLEYCRIHGIRSSLHSIINLHRRPATLEILSLLENAIAMASSSSVLSESGSIEEDNWIWWMDGNRAILTNMSIELPLQKYSNYGIVVFSSDHSIQVTADRPLQYSGSAECDRQLAAVDSLPLVSLLIRPSKWSLDILGKLKAVLMDDHDMLGSSDELYVNADQSRFIMEFLLNEGKEKVYLETSMSSAIYSRPDKNSHGNIIAWPLISHFDDVSTCDSKCMDLAFGAAST